MDGQEKPGTAVKNIDRGPTREEIVRATEEIGAPDGALRTLMRSSANLLELGHEAHKKFKMVSHRAELSDEEAYTMLFGHYGISGERGNGVTKILPFCELGQYMKDTGTGDVGKYIPQIADSLFRESEVSKAKKSPPLPMVAIPQKVTGIGEENALQAMDRCGKEIAEWVRTNGEHNRIDLEAHQQFSRAYEKYLSALKGIHAYADKVKAYMTNVAREEGRSFP